MTPTRKILAPVLAMAAGACSPTFTGPLSAKSVEYNDGSRLEAKTGGGELYIASRTVVTSFGGEIWPGSHNTVTIEAPQGAKPVDVVCTNLTQGGWKSAADKAADTGNVHFTARSLTAFSGTKGPVMDGPEDVMPGTQYVSYKTDAGADVKLRPLVVGQPIKCDFSTGL